MKNSKLLVLIGITAMLANCNPPKQVGSRLRSGTPASAVVSILQQVDGARALTFVHNHPDAGPENYKMSSLALTVPAASGAVQIDASSTKVSLPPVKFGISMVATASPRKLTCQASGIPMGTSSIACNLEGAVETAKDPDVEIANYILTKKTDIKSALSQVKSALAKGQTLPAAVEAHWIDLEKEAKVGGGFHGEQEAITSTIRSWNSEIDGYMAEKVAAVLVSVYRDSDSGNGTTVAQKNADLEIAKYLIEKPGVKISDALSFVQTNVLKAAIPSNVSSRWSTLEGGIKGYNGDVEAITGEIRSWNIDFGLLNPEDVARQLAKTYN